MESAAAPARILIVDDEPDIAAAIERMARHFGHQVTVTGSAEQALQRFDEQGFDVVLTDLRLSTMDGLSLLKELQRRAPAVPVILITGYASVDSAMEAIQAGAYDYLPKPPTLEALGQLLGRAIEKRRLGAAAAELETQPAGPARTAASAGPLEEVVGGSARMLDVYKTVARIAPTGMGVLILGESGTGKELVARALHHRSPRAARSFVPVNVSAIPEGLVESELFGHVKGAFTGATASRRGLFDEADRGTLFLDEIGDLSLSMQVRLLRVLQEHRIKPVGGNEDHEVDVRLVAATHRDLPAMVERGGFREDLYYRLNVIAITLPPLRERRDDIPLLVEHFLRKLERETGMSAPRFGPEAMRALQAWTWPGNVRELENVVQRAALLSSQGPIGLEALPRHVLSPPGRAGLESALPGTGEFPTLDEVIQHYVARVLEHTRGNRTRAAQILGISRRTILRMAERRRGGTS
jgi:DNA-binding NtrC family response regulator